MKNLRIMTALFLCLALTAGLVPAALAASTFPTTNTYTPGYYRDVPDGSWYADAAKTCYEAGLITGTHANTFSPNNAVSVSEAATLAARILSAINGETIPDAREGEAWYQRYVDYLEAHSVAVPNPSQNASRAQLFHLLAAVVPPEQLSAINSIQTLPDTDDPDILRFYNAGVLTGTDGTGTFMGSRGLKRSECATMVARIIDPALRQKFTPQAQAQTPTVSPETELLSTEAFRVNGISVSFQDFLSALNTTIYDTDTSLKTNSGTGLNWNTKYSGIDDLPQYFKDLAMSQLVESTLVSAQAKALGCSEEALPAILTPDPSKNLSNIYCAKHILVANEQTAKAIIAMLQSNTATDGLTLFDQLMSQYGTDPGMKSDPRGYIFTDGDMVTEFENAVKALGIGHCSTVPVKSSFGYHVILRLDPTTRSGWQQAVQELKYDEYVEQWVSSATVTPNTAELNKLDVPARYAQYLASLGG